MFQVTAFFSFHFHQFSEADMLKVPDWRGF